jgi:ABC-2 type transport system ATP-binding protein
MEEAYELCDEIAIMDHGQIIALGTPKALLAEHFNDVVLQLPVTAPVPDLAEVDSLDMIHQDNVLELRTGDPDRAIRSLLEHGVSLQDLRIRERTLEDLFLELTGKELRS